MLQMMEPQQEALELVRVNVGNPQIILLEVGYKTDEKRRFIEALGKMRPAVVKRVLNTKDIKPGNIICVVEQNTLRIGKEQIINNSKEEIILVEIDQAFERMNFHA